MCLGSSFFSGTLPVVTCTTCCTPSAFSSWLPYSILDWTVRSATACANSLATVLPLLTSCARLYSLILVPTEPGGGSGSAVFSLVGPDNVGFSIGPLFSFFRPRSISSALIALWNGRSILFLAGGSSRVSAFFNCSEVYSFGFLPTSCAC